MAILENYQQTDGSILVPDVLQPYMGGMQRIEKAKDITTGGTTKSIYSSSATTSTVHT